MASSNKTALDLLSEYSSGSECEDDIVPGPRVSTKRSFREDNDEKRENTKRLPLPSIFKPLTNTEDISDDPSLHEGRIRSFPHERGNWSTYVYISYDTNTIIRELMQNVIRMCKDYVILKPVDDLHISLSRTVVLKHHCIQPFVNSIKENLAHIARFILLFDTLYVYCNEEKTRTFIGIQTKSGHDSLLKLVKLIDDVLNEFKLPKFYDNPSFHMSILWCLGDQVEKINSLLPRLNALFEECSLEHPEVNWYIPVTQIYCKSGNKLFSFNLL